MEDVPGNENLDSFKESDHYNSPGSSSAAYLDGREVPMFNYNWETCQDMPFMVRKRLFLIYIYIAMSKGSVCYKE